MKCKLDASRKLASTCKSVWPGLNRNQNQANILTQTRVWHDPERNIIIKRAWRKPKTMWQKPEKNTALKSAWHEPNNQDKILTLTREWHKPDTQPERNQKPNKNNVLQPDKYIHIQELRVKQCPVCWCTWRRNDKIIVIFVLPYYKWPK